MADPLEEILYNKHRISRDLLAALQPADLERARTASMESGNPNRIRAINLLVAAGDAAMESILVRIFQNRDEDANFRAMAAAELGRIGATRDAEMVLRGSLLEERDPAVQIQMAGTLGRIGTPEALEPLARLAESSEGARREQAAFARAVIAQRHGLPGYELPVPDPREALLLNSERARPFTFSPAPRREALLALEDIRMETWGLKLKAEFCYLVQCGKARMLVALDAEAMGAYPRLLGLVADRSPEDGGYSVRWLLLSWRGDKESVVHVAVHRPSGPRILAGTLTIGRKGGSFELRSVDRPGGVPVLLRGQADGGSVEVVEALSEQTATPRKTPTPTQPPKRESSKAD